MIDEVRGHVSYGACSPVEPAAPIEWMIDRVIENFRSGAEEQVPVESCRNRNVASHRGRQCLGNKTRVPIVARPRAATSSGRASPTALRRSRTGDCTGSLLYRGIGNNGDSRWTRNTLRPDWAIRPRMDFFHRTYESRLNPFIDESRAFTRVALIAHLCDDLRPRGCFAQHPRLRSEEHTSELQSLRH